MRDTCSIGNRIGEPAFNVKPNRLSATIETHWEGGKVFVQLNVYSDQLNADT